MATIMFLSSMHFYTNFVWGLVLFLELIGVIVIAKRRLWREIPAFSAYFLYATATEILAILLYRHPMAYYVFYWTGEVGYKILNAWVILEIYVRLMRAFPALRKAASWTLWSALVIAFASALLVWFLAPLAKTDPFTQRLEQFGYSFKMLQLGLLVAVASIVHFFHLRLRRYYVFIAIGIAFVGLGDLSSYALASRYGYAKADLINLINITINAIGIAVWTYVLVTGEPRSPVSGAYAAVPVDELRKWNATLSDLNRS